MSDLCQVVDVEVLRNDDFFPKFRYRFELTLSTLLLMELESPVHNPDIFEAELAKLLGAELITSIKANMQKYHDLLRESNDNR
jgi:hypothetical protein